GRHIRYSPWSRIASNAASGRRRSLSASAAEARRIVSIRCTRSSNEGRVAVPGVDISYLHNAVSMQQIDDRRNGAPVHIYLSGMPRRSMLALAAAARLAAAATRVRLGGPVFLKSDDPAELAREHRRLGYSAAYCPTADLQSPERIRAIEKAFAAENVVI